MPPYAYKPTVVNSNTKFYATRTGASVDKRYNDFVKEQGQVKDQMNLPFKESVRKYGSAGISGASPISQTPTQAPTPAQVQSELAAEQAKLEAESQAQQKKVEAFNRVQRAASRGTIINRQDLQTAGLNYGQVSGAAASANLNRRAKELNQTNEQLLQRANAYEKQVVVKTLAAGGYGMSTLGGGSVAYFPERPASTKTAPISQANFQKIEQQKRETALTKQGADPLDVLIESSGQAVFGERGKIAGKGGVAQRSADVFYTTGRGFTEYGERVGGLPGKAVGALTGSAVGFGLATFEAGVGTPVRAIGGFISAPSGGGRIFGGFSPYVGTGYEVLTQLAASPRAGVAYTRQGVKAIQAGAELAPGLIRTGGTALSRGKTYSKVASYSERLAANAEQLLGGVKAGAQGIKTTSIYSTKAENIGVQAGRAIKAVDSARVSYPRLTNAGFITGSLVAPSIAESIRVAGATSEFKAESKTQRGEAGVQATFRGIEEAQASKGFVANVGGSLGFGVLGERYELAGGISKQETQRISEQAFRQQGYSAAQAQRLAKETVEVYRARQTGGLIGQGLLSTATELGGVRAIAPTIENVLIGQTVGVARPIAQKTSFNIAARVTPQFALFGATEGFLGTAIADITQRRAKDVRNVPEQIIQRPVEYGVATAGGALSSIILGVTPVTFASYRALRGKSGISQVGEKGTLGAGYALDPLEDFGDYTARFFGKQEPVFGVKTRIRRGVASSILTGVPLQQQTQVNVKRSTTTPGISANLQEGIFTPVGTNVTQAVNNLNIGLALPFQTQQNVQQQQLQQQQNVQLQSQQNTNVNINVPIPTPLSRSGFPFLPPIGINQGGRGGGARTRTKYIDEFALTFGALVGNNTRNINRPGRPKRVNNRRRQTFNPTANIYKLLSVPKRRRR